jgi:hypothetical protein
MKKVAVAVKAFRRERRPRSSFHSASSSLTAPWARAAVRARSTATSNPDAWSFRDARTGTTSMSVNASLTA